MKWNSNFQFKGYLCKSSQKPSRHYLVSKFIWVLRALPWLLLVVSYSPPHWNWSAIARMRRSTEKGILLFPSIIIIFILYIVRSIFPIILALFAYCCRNVSNIRDEEFYFLCKDLTMESTIHLCAKDMNTINKKKIERKFSFRSHNIHMYNILIYLEHKKI